MATRFHPGVGGLAPPEPPLVPPPDGPPVPPVLPAFPARPPSPSSLPPAPPFAPAAPAPPPQLQASAAKPSSQTNGDGRRCIKNTRTLRGLVPSIFRPR